MTGPTAAQEAALIASLDRRFTRPEENRMSYSQYDDDPWADVEALENERHEADAQQAEMNRAGNAIARARKAGRCCHQGTTGYLPPGQEVYPEQKGLKPGQQVCNDGCGRVFNSDQEWYAAMDEAVFGG